MLDCLIIGFNDSSFADYLKMVHAMGDGTGAYKDLSLAFVRIDGAPLHGLDVVNHFRARNIPALAQRKPGDPHPYVVGADAVKRYLTVASECAHAAQAALQ